MQNKWLARVAIAIVLIIAVATSLWFASPLPVKALDITFPSLPPSGTLGSTYSFTVTVNIPNPELVPIQSIDMEIYNVAVPSKNATCTNLPLNDGGPKSYSNTDTGGGGTVSVTASTTNWEYFSGTGDAIWKGTGYSFGTISGYGYSATGTASITYAVIWTSPAGWSAGAYKAEVTITAKAEDDTITTFTETSSEFTLCSSGIVGRVALEARPQGPAWVISATVQLWEVGADRTSASPIATYNVTTSNDGSFNIGIAPGNYDITIKGIHTLRNLAGNVGITQDAMTEVDFGTLTEGDCWGAGGVPDNIVDISDYSAILYSFGTMSGYDKWVATCDLNQDGVVDIADYSIVLFNFGQMGVAP